MATLEPRSGAAVAPPPRRRSRTERRPYTRHGLTAPMARVKLQGFTAIDRRTVAARKALALREDLVSALGGEANLSPQRLRLIDMTVRAALLVDHVDAWLFAQPLLVNRRSRALVPVLVQRQALAEHLAKLLDRLGLDRVPQKVQDLSEYIAARYGNRQDGPRSTMGDGPRSDAQTPDDRATASDDDDEAGG